MGAASPQLVVVADNEVLSYASLSLRHEVCAVTVTYLLLIIISCRA